MLEDGKAAYADLIEHKVIGPQGVDTAQHLPANMVHQKKTEFATDNSNLSANDLEKLKVIAVRLNLQTRRSSYVMWRSKLGSTLHERRKTAEQPPEQTDQSEGLFNSSNQSDEEKIASSIATTTRSSGSSAVMKRRQRTSEFIKCITAELMQIRQQDEALARQFISIRNELQQMRLQHSKQVYDDMVDDAQWTMAENEQLEGVCDEPRTLDKSPLITLGITKMNLTERRFSVF